MESTKKYVAMRFLLMLVYGMSGYACYAFLCADPPRGLDTTAVLIIIGLSLGLAAAVQFTLALHALETKQEDARRRQEHWGTSLP